MTMSLSMPTPALLLDIRRLQRLRRRALALRDARCPWERALWFTRGFRATSPADPMIIRRAQALAYTLKHVPLHIRSDDYLVGDSTRAVPGPPGVADQHAWTAGVSAPEAWCYCDPQHVPDAVARELAWWDTQRAASPWDAVIASPHMSLLRDEGVIEGPKTYFGHVIPYFQSALAYGYAGIHAMAVSRLAHLQHTVGATPAQEAFFRAVQLVCAGAIAFGARYAAKARAVARRTRHPERQRQLLDIADICMQVPAHPPRTFREALQMVWFVHYFNEEEAPAVHTHSFGRFDQYLYPFYRRDVEIGLLTRDDALALVAEFWIKCYRTFEQRHTMLGGRTPEGEDGANELTAICLEAIALVRLPRATGVRIDSHATDAYLEKILDVLQCGLGVPALYNDEVIIPALMDRGIPAHVAAEYGVTGCVELAIAGHAEFCTVSLFINLAKVLELALHDGCSFTGQRVGPSTGVPASLRSFAMLQDAFRRQLQAALDTGCVAQVAADRRLAAEQPMPLFSCLMPGCMTRGVDTLGGGADYNFSGICISEVATTANSLATLQQLVFEEQRLSLAAFVEILRQNFAGAEDLRLYLAHRMPKFGTDNPVVDRLAAYLIETLDTALQNQPHARSGAYLPLIFSRQHRQGQFGIKTGATADGRLAGEMLAISLNPLPGTATEGLTALLTSQNALPLRRVAGGLSNNIDLQPSLLTGNGRTRMISLLRTWARTGGMEMAWLVMDAETLRAAQADPARFRDLTVRVYGFSERYLNLDAALQEYLIQRVARGST